MPLRSASADPTSRRRSTPLVPAPPPAPPPARNSGGSAAERRGRPAAADAASSSKGTKDSDTPSTSSSAAAGHSQQVANAAALSRARAENVHLRRKLGIAPTGSLDSMSAAASIWGDALLAEVQQESHDERRVFSLKSELCLAVDQRRRLEKAVQARHSALERLAAGGNINDVDLLVEAEHLEGDALRMGREIAFEVEQHLAGAALTLDSLARSHQFGLGPDEKGFLSKVSATAATSAETLLQIAPDLPPVPLQQVAAARRQMHRVLTNKIGAVAATTPTSERGTPLAAIGPPQALAFSTLLGSPLPGSSAAHVPEELLLAWRDLLQAAKDERSLRRTVEAAMSEMVEMVAQWMAQIQHLQVAVGCCAHPAGTDTTAWEEKAGP